MTPDISHYPSHKIMGKVVHQLPESVKNSCRGCSFDKYIEATDDYVCAVTGEKSQDYLICGERPIVYVRPTKKHIMAYIAAKLTS